MNNLTVVIPSKTPVNFQLCAEAVRKMEPGVRVILVDDGIHTNPGNGCECCSRIGNVMNIAGMKPFVFSRNCNLGIIAAGDDDVVLLNDDALLETPGGFSLLQRAAYEYPEYGIVAAACDNVGNMNQWPRHGSNVLRDDPRMVCFTSVLIPRRTIEQIGLLDERFVDYGMDDDDYCLRVRQAGLKIGIHDGCVISHSKLTSTYRRHGGGDFRANLERFKEKWGVDNHGRTA